MLGDWHSFFAEGLVLELSVVSIANESDQVT